MNQIETTLVALGLTKTEAILYLAGLQHSAISVQDLARETSVKRPTIYHSLHTLVEKGLVAEQKKDGRTSFIMTSPEKLSRLAQEKKEDIEHHELELRKIIPILKRQTGQEIEKIHTVQYEGIEGIKTAVDIALYCKDKKWNIIAPIQNFFSEFDKEYAVYYLQTRKRKSIVARTLWERNEKGRKLTPEELRFRQPRIMPQTMQGRFLSTMILFDDKVAIITSLKKLSAVVITSQEIHDMLSAMFEGIWESSMEYKDAYKNL